MEVHSLIIAMLIVEHAIVLADATTKTRRSLLETISQEQVQVHKRNGNKPRRYKECNFSRV